MNFILSQDKRSGSLSTPLGADKLVLSRFDASEGVGELFDYRVEALSLDGDIDFDQLLGLNATVTLNEPSGGKRHFDGVVTETQWLGVRGQYHAYRLVLRPWLWVLSQRSDCFIYHEKSVTDIVSDVFGRHGALADFEDRTTNSYDPIEYCVQYRESDMAFVTRLMEEFGISWYFVHSDGAHRLVMVDTNSSCDTVEGGSRRYIPLTGQDRRSEQCLYHIIPERRFTTGKSTYRDYNFKTPSANMEASQSGVGTYEHADKETYDYPGRYIDQGKGRTVAQVKQEGEDALDKRCLSAGNCMQFFPGGLFSLKEHPYEHYNKEYLLLRCQHSFISQQYSSGSAASGEESYEGQYEMLDSETPYHPQHLTQRPLVHGPQTAIVVGAKGEEIDCDEHGRILVRFHWDRKSDQSMRCRVAQNWASQQWGGMIIPRIGMEVVVEFLEGDPDRPIVTGAVYNGNNKPPYELPANKTRSVFKTNSHKGSGYNEIRFEDEAGQEEVWFHAQKYHNAVVEDDETWNIGGNRHKRVAKSQSEVIGVDKEISVGSNHIEAIGSNMSLTVGATRSTNIGSDENLTVGSNQAVSIGGSRTVSVGVSNGVEAGQDQYYGSGMTHHIKAGMKVVIEAGASITLSSAGGFITIDPSGIAIQGTMVRINSGGAAMSAQAMSMKTPKKADKYSGDKAKRYERSFKK